MKAKHESPAKTKQLTGSIKAGTAVGALGFSQLTSDWDAPSISHVLSPDLLKRLLDFSQDLICAFTRDGTLFTYNESWTRFFPAGNNHCTLKQKALEIDPETQLLVVEPHGQCTVLFKRDSISRWETDVEGSYRWITWRLKFDSQLSMTFIVGVDETGVKAKELEEEKLRETFNSEYGDVIVGICQSDLDRRFLRVNEGFCRMTGYKAKELEGTPFADITHPEDVTMGDGQFELLLAGEINRFAIEKRYIKKDGEIIKAYLTVTLVRDERGDPKFFMAAIADITSSMAANKALQKSEEYFRTLIDPNDRTYFTADCDGNILELSKNAGLTTGVGPEGLVENGWQLLLHPDDKERVLRDWTTSIATGIRCDCEYRLKVLDGTYEWVRSQVLPHRDADGEILCWYGCTDHIHAQKITEDKLARLVAERTHELVATNQALIEARDAALAASLAKSQFLANMSHEIRTPMNGVIGIASLLREQDLDPKCRSMVDIICQSGDNLIKIIGDILDFSKLEAGKVVLELAPTDLLELVSEVAALFQVHARSKGLGMRFEVAPGSIPVVMCDQLRLRQVLSNLISNAIKFTQSGSVIIRMEGAMKDNRYHLSLEIQDDGIGIPPEAMHAIFESFTQGDGSIQRKFGGTGLGLTICKDLVKMMGGTLAAKSQVGSGTTMILNMALDPATEDLAMWI